MFGIHSLAQTVLDHQFYSTTNKGGATKWRPRTLAADFLSRLPKQPVHSRPRPNSSNVGRKTSCSGSCMDPSQCSLDSNCMCASGMSNFSSAQNLLFQIVDCFPNCTILAEREITNPLSCKRFWLFTSQQPPKLGLTRMHLCR